jgi:TRAP-type C4-dicarboxylate transport system permease small subunit
MGWADEVVELAFAWMVFLGTAALWRENAHIAVTFLPDLLAGTRGGRLLEGLVTLLALGFLVTFTWEGWLLTGQAVGNRTPILELPKPLWYLSIPVAGVVMIGYTLRLSFRMIRSPRAPNGRRQLVNRSIGRFGSTECREPGAEQETAAVQWLKADR